MNIVILQKRLAGVLSILIVRTLFIASAPNDCIYVVKKKIDSSHLKDVVFHIDHVGTEEENTVLNVNIKDNKRPDLKKRYNGLGYANEHFFIRQTIDSFMPSIKKYCDIYDIPASVIMALFINEFVKPAEKRFNVLAEKHFNYGSLKKKNDAYLSNELKDILSKMSKGYCEYKDDERNKEGVLVESSFYSFKSKEAGIYACIAFIADRAKSNHPNYAGKFDGLTKDNIYEWAYALYDAGYANKKANEYPLDKKLIRIIRTYKLAGI